MNKETILKGIIHLNNDLKIKPLIKKYNKPIFDNTLDNFNSIIKIIIYQQLSGKAANSIYLRFLDLFKETNITPETVSNLKSSILRSTGLSHQKLNYIISLSNFFINGGQKIDFSLLSNEEIFNILIQIKGIGQWTIDMFLMFTLYREDVFPMGDLGIKKAVKKLYKMEDLPSKNEMQKLSKKWKPYRTLACWYLWRFIDDEIFW